MRFNDIQKSILLKESTNKITSSLNTLGTQIEDLEQLDSSLADKARDLLTALYNKTLKAFKKSHSDSLNMPINENTTVASQIDQLQLLIDALAQNDPDSPYISDIQNTIISLTSSVKRAVVKARKEGRDLEFTSGKAYDDEFAKLIEFLAHKAAGSLEAFEANYKEQARTGIIKGGKLTPEQIESNNNIKANASKQALKDTVVIKAIKDTLTSVFGEATKNINTRAELTKKRKRIKLFLKACIKGVLPLNDLFDKGQGNVTNAFAETEYGDLKNFVRTLLGKVPSSGGAGSWGPAELALAIIGTPVAKATKGDLNIGGKMYELKASKNAKSGGRINTEALDRGKSGKAEYTSAWDTYAEGVLGLKKKGRTIAYSVKSTAKKVKKGQEYKNKEIKFTSVGPTLINNVLNPAIMAKTSAGVDVSAATKTFIQNTVLAPIIGEYRADAARLFKLSGVIKRDGTIDAAGFLSAYLNMLLGLYHQTDEVDSILVINPDTGNFHVISATDTKSLHQKIKNGDIQTSSLWIDFDDAQSKASPQIGTA